MTMFGPIFLHVPGFGPFFPRLTVYVNVILEVSTVTRLGPYRVAADMEGNGEFDFMVIFIYIFVP